MKINDIVQLKANSEYIGHISTFSGNELGIKWDISGCNDPNIVSHYCESQLNLFPFQVGDWFQVKGASARFRDPLQVSFVGKSRKSSWDSNIYV